MHATAATVPRARAPPTGPALVNQAPASSPARRRADSPSAHGTVRFVGGQREFLPPSTHHAQNGNGAPGPRAMDQAFQEPNPGPFFPPPHQPAATKKSSSVAQLDQSKIDMLIDACGTHRLIILMGHTYQDGPEITRSKVIVRTCAVNSSEPNDGVKNKGLEWLAIFHSIRRDLVARAVEIAYLPEAEQEKQLEITTDKYFEFDNLLQWVLEARTAVVKGIHHTPYIQDQWTAAGRKDVLDRVVEKETALASERAMRGRESSCQPPTSRNQADMTIKVETTVQQTSERIDPQETTGQSFGVSTTINGPARKTVHFEPGVGQLRIGDRENGEFDLVGLGMQQQQAFVELPPGVDAVLAITIDQRLQPSERVKDYLAALEAVSVALFNAQAERESETNIAYELEAQTSDARADYDTDESL